MAEVITTDHQLLSDLTKLTFQLITFESTPTNSHEKTAIIDFCEEYLQHPNIYLQKYNVNGHPSLVATFEQTKAPQIFLYAHLDVVPAEKEDFIARIEDGKLYGRGSGDMKSAAAVILMLMKYFADLPKRPSIGLMLTTDEETGGFNGVRYLLEEEGYSCECAILPDSSRGVDTVIVNQKGILQLKIWTNGKSAHGSRPFLGENAIKKLFHLYEEITKIFPEHEQGIFSNTVNLGQIRGGLQINQVPDYAEMFLDIRYVTQEDREKIYNTILTLSHGNVEIVNEGAPFHIASDNFWLQKYMETGEKYLGTKLKTHQEEGGSDARFFAQKGIPAIVNGVAKGNAHSKEEWVKVDEIGKFYELLKRFVLEQSINATFHDNPDFRS